MVQLPPSEFTFGSYGWTKAPWDAIKSTKGYTDWLLTQPIIGYCDGAIIEIRPRLNDMAVMFEDEEYKGWNHIPKEIWKIYLKQLKNQAENENVVMH